MTFYVKGKEIKLQGFLEYLDAIGYHIWNDGHRGSVVVYTNTKEAGRVANVKESDYDVEESAERICELLNVKDLNCNDFTESFHKLRDYFGNTTYRDFSSFVQSGGENIDWKEETTKRFKDSVPVEEIDLEDIKLDIDIDKFYESRNKKEEEELYFSFPEHERIKKENQGKKETEGKTNYEELDWDYIDAVADRMSSNKKYPPKNWQKPMDVKKLAESAMRHARKILQEIDGDEESLQDHAVALACNGQMVNFQLKNKDND